MCVALLRLVAGQYRFETRRDDAQQIEHESANQQGADRPHHLSAGELNYQLLVRAL